MGKAVTRHPLLLLLPLQAALLFWRLDWLPGWDDEEFTRAVVTAAWPEAARMLGTDIHPPLYFVLARIWLRLPWAIDPLIALRALSALAALAAGVAVHVCWVRHYDRRARWWFAALWVTSPFLLLYGRMARSYTLQMLLGVLTVAAAERVLAQPQRGRPLAAYTAAAALLLYTHYLPAAALMAAVGAVLLWRLARERDPSLLVPLLAPPLVIGSVYVPWFSYLAGVAAKFAHGAPYVLTTNPVLERLVELAYVLVAFSGAEMLTTWALPVAALAVPAALWLATVGAAAPFAETLTAGPGTAGGPPAVGAGHRVRAKMHRSAGQRPAVPAAREPATARPAWLGLVVLAAAMGFVAAGRWVSYAFIAARLSFVYPFWLLLLVGGIVHRPLLGRAGGVALLALALAGIVSYVRVDGFLNKAYVIPAETIAARIAADAPAATTVVLVDPHGANVNLSLRRHLPADLPVVVLWEDAASEARRRATDPGGRTVWIVRSARDRSPDRWVSGLEAVLADDFERREHLYVPYTAFDRLGMRIAGWPERPTHVIEVVELRRR